MLYLPPDPKEGQPIRARDITAILKYLRSITPRSSAACDVQVGAGGTTFKPKFPGTPSGLLSAPSAWPFKVYDASTAGTLQVRINSGDGLAGAINSGVGCVNGTPISTPVAPATAPLLAAGTGFVYAKVWVNPDGTLDLAASAGGTGVDCIFSTTALAQDTAVPVTFALQLLATLTQTGSGSSASLVIDNSTSTGFSGLQLCAQTPYFW